MKLLTTIEVV